MRLVLLSLALLTACQPEEREPWSPPPATPVAPAATIRGGEIVRVVAGPGTLFTSHADRDGLWLQATAVDGRILWHTYVTPGAGDRLRFSPIDDDEAWVSWAEDDGVVVWRVGDVDHLQLGGATLPGPLAVLSTHTLDDGGVEVFAQSGDDLTRLHFAATGELVEERRLEDFVGVAYDAAGLPGGSFAVLASHGTDPSETLKIYSSAGLLLASRVLDDGPGSEARLVGFHGDDLLVEVSRGDGRRSLEQVAPRGEYTTLDAPADALAVAASGEHRLALAAGDELVVVSFGGEHLERLARLGPAAGWRVDELVALPGAVAVRGAREGVEGLFVYALP